MYSSRGRLASACAEDFLGAPVAVDVRGVEEVDAELERDFDELVRGVVGEAAAERRPRPEADLRDPQIAVAELPVLHYSSVSNSSVSIWARWSLPE